ncbi:MAG: DUF3450 domain-containing protein [Pseudomonadota bacterium]
MRHFLTPGRGLVAATVMVAMGGAAEAQLGTALDTGQQATSRAEQVQRQINQLDDERSDMVREYRTLLQRRDAAELFARQQEQVVQSQRREVESLTEQLGRIDEITAETVPMLIDMIADLKAFVAADLPFKSDFRQARLDGLDAAMNDPQVSTAEKYRLIIEAYQAEMEYGSTIDTWQTTQDVGGAPTNVDMFQYGRVALVWLTPDDRQAARWVRATASEPGRWEPITDGGMRAAIREAIRVASGKKQQEVLFAPVTPLSITD